MTFFVRFCLLLGFLISFYLFWIENLFLFEDKSLLLASGLPLVQIKNEFSLIQAKFKFDSSKVNLKNFQQILNSLLLGFINLFFAVSSHLYCSKPNLNKKIFKTDSNKNLISELNPDFVTGLTEAEGSFSVAKAMDKRAKFGYNFNLRFKINAYEWIQFIKTGLWFF